MFYEGNVQSGIALALQESKAVACFVKDGGPESSRWETEYLQDAQIARALAAKAVTLSIQAGSQDAQFLAAYYPVKSTPTLLVIRWLFDPLLYLFIH